MVTAYGAKAIDSGLAERELQLALYGPVKESVRVPRWGILGWLGLTKLEQRIVMAEIPTLARVPFRWVAKKNALTNPEYITLGRTDYCDDREPPIVTKLAVFDGDELVVMFTPKNSICLSPGNVAWLKPHDLTIRLK